MPLVFRKFAKRLFVFITILISAVFLLACCNAFLHPQTWWFVAILGLGFPLLLILVIASMILWIVFRSKWVLLPIACLILGYTNIRSLLAFNFGKETSEAKPPATVRLMTWNVTWFDEQTKTDKSRLTYRNEMFNFIRQQNADILCFQEYMEPNTPRKNYNNRNDITKLGYPHSIIAMDYIGWKGSYQSGIAIFSKYPITDSVHIRYPGPKSFRAGESLLAADIKINGKTIRVFTTHLQSVLFQKTDYGNLEKIKTASDSLYEASKSVVKKLAQGYRFRGQQADIVKRHVAKSPHPSIICGDFNDIPNSYTYFQMRSGRKDAFIEAGSGIGRTFSNISPTLRIDYILPDEAFEVVQYKRFVLPYSEHYPLVTDLKLPSGN